MAAKPICVSLDGTLVRTGTLMEGLLALLRPHPLSPPFFIPAPAGVAVLIIEPDFADTPWFWRWIMLAVRPAPEALCRRLKQ